MMVTVQVFSQATGETVTGILVGISRLWSGEVMHKTDHNGEAHFSTIFPVKTDGNAEVYVGDKLVFKGCLEDCKIVRI